MHIGGAMTFTSTDFWMIVIIMFMAVVVLPLLVWFVVWAVKFVFVFFLGLGVVIGLNRGSRGF